MTSLLERVDGALTEARALFRAAGSYLIGLDDPHDEDLVEIIRCDDDDVPEACYPTPVFLVHGYTHNWSGWLPLMAHLEAAGFVRFVRVNYESAGDSPDEAAGRLSRLVHEVAVRTKAERMHFVGHSLGGVVIRIVTGYHGAGARLGHAVTLGSPLRGTPWGHVPFLPDGVRELRPGSELVRLLENLDDDRTRWTTVAGDQDVLVPPRWAHLDGAQQVTVQGAGHVGLLYDQRAWDAVRDALVAAELAAGALSPV